MSESTRPAQPDDVVPPPKGRRRLWIVTGLALLLAAGGVAAYLLTRPAAKHARATTQEPVAEPIYVALDPAFVVNFESGTLVRFLQVTVQTMVEDPATADAVKRHDPVIRNGLLMLFSDQTYETLATREGKERLRLAALAEVRRVVESQGGDPARVRDAYFTSFVMQ